MSKEKLQKDDNESLSPPPLKYKGKKHERGIVKCPVCLAITRKHGKNCNKLKKILKIAPEIFVDEETWNSIVFSID